LKDLEEKLAICSRNSNGVFEVISVKILSKTLSVNSILREGIDMKLQMLSFGSQCGEWFLSFYQNGRKDSNFHRFLLSIL